MPHLHVALVTGRPEANLIPLLQLQPEHIVLVASQGMVKEGERLKALLDEQLPSTLVELETGLPDTDPAKISHFAVDLTLQLEARRESSHELQITFDMTGGTKLMGLLFQEAMRSCGAKMLYTDSTAGVLYHLGADLHPSSFSHTPIAPVLDCKLYLQANGKCLRQALSDDSNWRDRVEQRKAITKYLGKHADVLGDLFRKLNYLIRADDPGRTPVINKGNRRTPETLNQAAWEQSLPTHPGSQWREALKGLDEAGLVEWSIQDARRLAFPTLEGAQYLSGGWVEEYAWHCARDAGLKDVYCGAQVTDDMSPKDDIRNEFDLVAVHRNRMLIIECKTSRLDNEGPDQQVLHKLHSLSEQSSGLFGTKVLLSAQPFGSKNQHAKNIQRAKSMMVEVLDGAGVKQLSEKLRHWVNEGRWPT